MNASALREYLDRNSVSVPGGREAIRMYKPGTDWISSDYRLSSPSLLHQNEEQIVECTVADFSLLAFPVTRSVLAMAGLVDGIAEGDRMLPAVCMSWDEAIEICDTLSSQCGLEPCYPPDLKTGERIWRSGASGYRLPTEAEWQHACRAGSSRYQYGKIDDIAWHAGNSGGVVQPVAQKQPNTLGLYDMLGNVWEWCWDTFDPATHPDYRVFRGGSCAEEARICGATTRRKGFRNFRIDDLGFRIARNTGKSPQ